MLEVEMGRTHVIAGTLLVAFGCGPRVETPAEDLGCEDTRVDTRGCQFALVPPLHLVPDLSRAIGLPTSRWEPDGVLVVNEGPESARIQLVEANDPDKALADARTLSPNESLMLRLPRGDGRSETGTFDGYLLTADSPVSAVMYAPYRSFLGNDSGLLLPSNAWGSEYVASAYSPHAAQFQGLGEPTFFDVLTLQSGITIRWRPLLTATAAGDDIGEVGPGTWSPPIALEPGVPLRVVALHDDVSPFAADVSGTWVEATGPVSVQAGSRCSAVPIETEPVSGCDPLFEPLPPVSSWGTRYALPHPPLRTREQHHYRVFAGEDQLELTILSDGVERRHTLEQRGSFLEFAVAHGTSVVISGTRPFLPVGYLETRDPDPTVQLGDPAMYTIVPPERFLARQVVATGIDWSTHWLQIVREQSDAPLLLDGVLVEDWEIFADFETVNVEVTEGVYVLESDVPFGVTQFGWTNEVHDACLAISSAGTCQTSYAHPAGFGVQPR